LGRAMGQLPHAQLTALLLIAAQGLTYEDAARLCGCPIGTVKSRVQRARTRLAEIMRLDVRCELGLDRITRAVLQSAV
jgi:RNA polymerase sigma-70 factor (ECF subfamily)